jgi:tetratricopeptide (TPR) repeat protein
VGISYWYWGMTEVYRGNAVEGMRLIDDAFAINRKFSGVGMLTEGDYLRMATVYQKLGETGKLLGVYEALTKRAPTRAQYHAALALTYARLGQRDNAIAEAVWAAQLDSKLEAEARIFVKQIGGEWKGSHVWQPSSNHP